DGDGVADLLVGSRTFSAAAASALGKVYLFSGATGEELWSREGESEDEQLGAYVAAGDVDGDGVPDVLAAALGPAQRSALLFSGADGTLIRRFLRAGPPIAMADLDLDGHAEVMLSPTRIYSGATGERLLQFDEPPVKGMPPTGSVLGVIDSLDDDANPDLIIGSGGQRILRSGATGEPIYRLYLDSESTGGTTSLGDVDGDGVADLAVGRTAYVRPVPGHSYGYLLAYSGRTGARLAVFSDGVLDSSFGASVASVGDLNGDGAPDLLVAAPNYDGLAGENAGRVYAYSLAPTGGDADGDGSFAVFDCDDGSPAVNPAAEEVCDGVDTDCSPAFEETSDFDQDGVTICGGDCDDRAAATAPGKPELCNGVDDDCDGEVDEDFGADADGDGFLAGCECDDANAAVNPDAAELCNGVDDDCDGGVDEDFDFDKDGFATCTGDCDDRLPFVHPGAEEVCDGVDDDCDGVGDDQGVCPTFLVTKTSDTDDGACDADCSLREAIEAANARAGADRVAVPPGVYVLDLGVLPCVSEDFVLEGAGSNSTAIDVGTADRIIDIGPCGPFGGAPSTVVMKGIAFDGGGATEGPIIDATYYVGVEGCVFRNLVSEEGDSFIIQTPLVMIRDSLFQGNASRYQGGGARVFAERFTVERSAFIENSSPQSGGLHIGGSGLIENVTISGNQAEVWGALGVEGGPEGVILRNVTIADNTTFSPDAPAAVYAGAVFESVVIDQGGAGCEYPAPSLGHNIDAGD
ncbi:MAG: FG-GAP-like repeat-containing protein, partial [Candidatus Methylomirabilis sp.]|nr:FG-GAP-like repeat-containing protein [Deltaproteobacteria bacterium]